MNCDNASIAFTMSHFDFIAGFRKVDVPGLIGEGCHAGEDQGFSGWDRVRTSMHQTITGTAIRRICVERSFQAHAGHIGSSLSIADILSVLYSGPLYSRHRHAAERNRFILSKGHASLAMYAAMHLAGELSEEELATFLKDGSRLGVHPEPGQRGVDFGTGSLGMGMTFAVGSALAAKAKNKNYQVYAVISDAELNEGVVWEAAMAAAQWKLDNLHVILDNNGQQALGYTSQVINTSNTAERWNSFGWSVQESDGHDVTAMNAWLSAKPSSDPRPRILVARTTFGKGVSFMEKKIEWHYLSLTEEKYHQALREIDGQAL